MTGMPSAVTPARSRWRLIVPLIFVTAGLLFAISFQTAKGTDLRNDRGLPGLVDASNRTVAARQAQLERLQREIDSLTKAVAPGDTTVDDLSATASMLAPVAGTRAVEGPALRVTLDDATRSTTNLPSGVTADDLVVHQQDVQAVVNALWRGGAEAMMIQDQRVIATSAVRCVGNTLILQGRVYSPPFVITAIGKVPDLMEALDEDEKVSIYRQWVDAVGLGYEVRNVGKVTFPAYSGAVSLSQARVIR